MMRKGIKLFGLLVLLAVPSGCWNSIDIQAVSFVTVVGLDYVDGKYVAYNQVLNFSNVAKSETVETGKEVPVWISKTSGDTFAEAVRNAIPKSQMHLFWGHVKAIIVSERVLQHGFKDIIDAINRFREVRYTIFLYGTKEPLEKILTQHSMLNFSPVDSIMASPQRSYMLESKIPQKWAYKLFASLYEAGNSAILPSLGIATDTWYEDQTQKPQFVIDGAFFFNQLHLAGWMSAAELEGVNWMQRQMKQSGLQVPDNGEPEAYLILTNPKIKISTIVKGDDDVRFNIRVKLKGQIVELLENLTMEEVTEDAKKAVEKQIRKTYLNAVAKNIDVYKLSEVLYRRNPKLFNRLVRDGVFPLAPDSLESIDVNIQMKHSGRYKLIL